MKQTIFILIISVLFFSSCKENSNEPCDYYKYEILAKVTSIEPFFENGKQLYHVALKFNGSSLSKELQYLEKIKGIEIDSTFIKTNHIAVGYSYEGLVSEIKEGNCTPLFISINHNFKMK